jgi:hypothetical protein
VATDDLFCGVVIRVLILSDHLVDFYLSKATGGELWDALEANFNGSNVVSELYI